MRPSDEPRISDPRSIDINPNALLSQENIEHPPWTPPSNPNSARLGNLVEAHVRTFYQDGQRKGVNQFAVEHATTGLSIPWVTILTLLGKKTRGREPYLYVYHGRCSHGIYSSSSE
jgi:hypothetical protein